MIFFSSDPDFEIFYNAFSESGIQLEALVTESPKKQGRNQTIAANPAHAFAEKSDLKVLAFEKLDEIAVSELSKIQNPDSLGFIFAYGKIIPKNIISQFENGVLNIHFSLLPEYPGASPIQQALLDSKKETGYTIFKITSDLDQGKILIQEKIKIEPNDNFDTLRYKIITQATKNLPDLIKKYINQEIALSEMPRISSKFTRRISKEQGLISSGDTAETAFNKIRAFSRWPKAYLILDGKRLIIHKAHLKDGMLEIDQIQPEGKKIMSFIEFCNGYRTLLTKMPEFVKIN